MSPERIVQSAQADEDIEQAVAQYRGGGGVPAARGFLVALKEAYAHIARFPATGSPRYAHELRIPDLRTWQLRPHPYLVFFIERDDHIDVWRVLHGRRDLPATFADV